MSAKQHPERGITMEKNKNKVTMSDMLLTYVKNRQAEYVRDMFESMFSCGFIDFYMWKEWNHIEDLLNDIRSKDANSYCFEIRADLFVQVLEEAQEFDSMDDLDRYSHLVKHGTDPFGSV